jgi:hypothetical protein
MGEYSEKEGADTCKKCPVKTYGDEEGGCGKMD